MAKIRKEEDMATPVSALIDVVFLLIIFFVVTASMEEELVDETISLAQAQNVDAVEKKNPLAVTVNVKADGTMNIATIDTSVRSLQQLLTVQRANLGNTFPVVIRADGETKFMHVDRVMDAVKKAKLYKVSISAESTK